MNAIDLPTLPAIGTPMPGGLLAGHIRIGEQNFALIVAHKAEGDHDDIKWNENNKMVDGATSYFDGLANTAAMLSVGSKLAEWVRGLRIGGFDDWYLPSQDELEIMYRNLKPTTDSNYQYGRSGINMSALPPTYPYTPSLPAQTAVQAFQRGNAEAFEPARYWSSTQHAADSDCAWGQDFDDGYQRNSGKDDEWRARAVRRVAIE